MDLKKLVKTYGQDTRRIEPYNVDLIYNQSQPSSNVVFQPPPIQAIINNIPTNQAPTSFNFYVPPPPPSQANLQDDLTSFSKIQPNRIQISEEEKKKRLERLQMNNPHLKELMQKLATPEDIQKWREERKAKFPTKERVEQKEKEIQEQIDRGELPPNRRRSRSFGGSSRTDRAPKKHKYQHTLKQRHTTSNNNASTTTTTTNDNNITEENSQQPSDKKVEPRKRKQTIVKKKPTLLEQLIQKDVDKAIILQCLRYIVQHNFFGQGQPKT